MSFTERILRQSRERELFSVEYLPGQFDQRADSAVQCVQFLREDEEPIIRSATTYVIEGEISEDEYEAIKKPLYQPGRFQRDQLG